MQLYSLVLVTSSKETVYMTDSLKRVKARKKALETSQRGQRNNYVVRPSVEDEEKYQRPPSFNFDPSGDAGSRKHNLRKARAKRIKQKNPTKKEQVVPNEPSDEEGVVSGEFTSGTGYLVLLGVGILVLCIVAAVLIAKMVPRDR